MTKDEALKLALEYVELVQDDRYNAEHIDREALVTAIKEALANVATNDTSQERVDKTSESVHKPMHPQLKAMLEEYFDKCFAESAPQRKPLTDEDLRKLADKHLFYQPEGYEVSGVFALARAIEAAHGIKGEA